MRPGGDRSSRRHTGTRDSRWILGGERKQSRTADSLLQVTHSAVVRRSNSLPPRAFPFASLSRSQGDHLAPLPPNRGMDPQSLLQRITPHYYLKLITLHVVMPRSSLPPSSLPSVLPPFPPFSSRGLRLPCNPPGPQR